MAETKRTSRKPAARRADGVVADLARRGEIRARDLQRLTRALIERAERNRNELARLIRKEIKRQVSALGLATHAEVEALRKRVRALERPRTRRSAAKKP